MHRQNLKTFWNFIILPILRGKAHVLIGGDFNCGDIEWSTMQVPTACADPGIFIRGVQVSWQKKALTAFFFFFFFFLFCPQLILQKSNGQFQRNIPFFNVPEGVQHFTRGGSNFFQGGSNCLLPLETHITCDFPGGSGPPVPPLWIRTCTGYKNGRLNLTFFSQMFQPL